MFTTKFIVRGVKNSLKLRIFLRNKMTELSIPGMFVSPGALENALSKNPVSENLRLSRCLSQWNSQITNLRLGIIEGGADGNVSLSLTQVRDLLSRELFGQEEHSESNANVRSWEIFYAKYAESKKNRSYKESCEYTLKKMREFDKSDKWSLDKRLSEMTFEDISMKWLNAFDEWLVNAGVSQNTRNIHFKNIRTCLNRAIDEELTNNYPFRRFRIRAEQTRKRNLPVEELRRLFNYDVEDYQKYYLDYFKLIFMLIGINTIDLFNLTKIENGRIEYRRAKTKRLYSIKVESEAMEIIKRHLAKTGNGLLDITDRWSDHRGFQKYCNEALKKIGKTKRTGRGGKKEIKPEWPELSTYWARHSWSTIAYSIDIPKDIISQALGHSSGNAITEIYIERDQKKVDEANRRVLDWVLYRKR